MSNWSKLQKKNASLKKSKKVVDTRVKQRTSLSTLAKEHILKNTKPPSSLASTTLNTHQSAKIINNNNNNNNNSSTQNTQTTAKVGKFIAMDCEFVGVGPEGIQSELARVSIVDFFGKLVYDKYVQPRERVTDWRTYVSGIRPSDMQNAISFKQAQKEVSDILKNRVLVGHAIHHDLEALYLTHPRNDIRDTSTHTPFKTKYSKGKTPSLKKLAAEILKIDIQSGEHSSVEDARATMLIYKSDRHNFEIKHRK